MVTVSQLRDVGLVDNGGNIIDYPGLSISQCSVVIKDILAILNKNFDGVESVISNIKSYTEDTYCDGRSMYTSFPGFIIRDLIRDYGPKMIDYMLLQDD